MTDQSERVRLSPNLNRGGKMEKNQFKPSSHTVWKFILEKLHINS
jgi:hypothetical protein